MTMTAPGRAPAPSPADEHRTRPARRARGGALAPYALLAPAVAVLVAVLGYPLLRLVLLSLREYGLAQQFGQAADFVGLENYRTVLADPQFRAVLFRTVAFCAVCVALTMTIGLLIGLLVTRLGRVLRLAVLGSLLLAWAMPPLSATIVWQWMFDTQYGLVNWVLAHLSGGFEGHAWLSGQLSFYAVAALVVVWMGVPFVAFTIYGGLTQVPKDLLEAAAIDGASASQRFRFVVLPFIKPILAILTALSVLWDFRVFTQVYVLQKAGGIARDTDVIGVYAYRISVGGNRFDVGAAVAVVMVVIVLLFTALYLRQIAKQEEAL